MSKSAAWVKISPEKLGTLAICALRYCQGRETYMPRRVREIVMPFLPWLSDLDILTMLEDCDRQRKYNLYGDDRIDKPGWDEWREQVQAEQKRRQDIEKEDGT